MLTDIQYILSKREHYGGVTDRAQVGKVLGNTGKHHHLLYYF